MRRLMQAVLSFAVDSELNWVVDRRGAAGGPVLHPAPVSPGGSLVPALIQTENLNMVVRGGLQLQVYQHLSDR